MKESNWYIVNVCKECDSELSQNIKFYSLGVCPHCGHDSRTTVCSTTRVVLKKFKHHSWWKFWNKKYTYEGKDEFSKQWINEHLLKI